jgi:transcriptional regulator with XRE-family HTH domain
VHSSDAESQATAPQAVDLVAVNVRKLRAISGWSTRAFAEHAGLSLSSLYAIEHGKQKTLRLETLNRLARAFGVHVASLVALPSQERSPWTSDDPSVVTGTALKTLRKANGLTQQALASKSGVPRDIVAKIEGQTRSANIDVLERLALALKTSLPELLGAGPEKR